LRLTRYEKVATFITIVFIVLVVSYSYLYEYPRVTGGITPVDNAKALVQQETTEKTDTDFPIHINKASKADFMKLNGIGETLAQRIIEYREKNGDFEKIEDLKKVKGIGEKIFDKIKDDIDIS